MEASLERRERELPGNSQRAVVGVGGARPTRSRSAPPVDSSGRPGRRSGGSSTSRRRHSPPLLAFTAVPAVLVLVVGNPLSGGLGHTWRPVPRDALCVLAVAAWVAWAACCAQLAALRGRPRAQRRRQRAEGRLGDGPDRDADRRRRHRARLLSGLHLALSSGAGASAPTTSRTVGVAPSSVRTRGDVPPALAAASHAVQPGDTVWSIAEERLADGADWTAIAALNLGRDMGGGTRFVDPDHIRAGWHLRLPRRCCGGRVRASTARAPRDGTRAPANACRSWSRSAWDPSPAPRWPGGPGAAPPVDPFTGDLDLGPTVSERGGRRGRAAAPLRGGPGTALVRGGQLPPGKVAAGRSRRARGSGPSASLRPASRSGSPSPGPTLPHGFVPLCGGTAWHVDHAAAPGTRTPRLPYVPIALPIGDDEEGTWLVALGPGRRAAAPGRVGTRIWRGRRGRRRVRGPGRTRCW